MLIKRNSHPKCHIRDATPNNDNNNNNNNNNNRLVGPPRGHLMDKLQHTQQCKVEH